MLSKTASATEVMNVAASRLDATEVSMATTEVVK